MHTTDECHSHADFEYLRLRPVTDHLELAPVLPVHGSFHDVPRALATRSRSLQEVFPPTSGRDFENFERLTSDTPVASLVFSPRSRDGGFQLGRDRFPRLPREERAAATTRGIFHRDNAGRPATQPFRATPVLREDELAVSPPRFAFRRHFARRGLPLGLAPVQSSSFPVKEGELALLWARRRRSTSATQHEVQTHRAIAPCLTRVLAEARHALLVSEAASGAPVPCENGPLRDCPCGRAPAEVTESEDCLVH